MVKIVSIGLIVLALALTGSRTALAWPGDGNMFLQGDSEIYGFGIVGPNLLPPSGDGTVTSGIGGGGGVEYFPSDDWGVRAQFTYLGYGVNGGTPFSLMALTGGAFYKIMNFEKDYHNFLYFVADGGLSPSTETSYVLDAGLGVNMDQIFVEWKWMWAPTAVPVPGGKIGIMDAPVSIGVEW